MNLLRGPLWIDGRASPIRRHPPALGQHTPEILAELGFNDDVITAWLRKGVAGGP